MSYSMNKTTLLFIRKTLEQCARCLGFYGAVLATPDGLVLASAGQLQGDEPAACASSLLGDATAHLEHMVTGQARELLVWTDTHLWNVQQLQDGFTLLLASTQRDQPETLRTITHQAASSLEPALRLLGY